MRIFKVTKTGVGLHASSFQPIVSQLQAHREMLESFSYVQLLDFFEKFAQQLLEDERTMRLEGVMFLSNWLKRSNLEKLLSLNLNQNPEYLDRFLPNGRDFLAAKPHGLVAMWMAGNVATLPMFSLVPALLAKNVCLVKLANQDPEGFDKLLAVFEDTATEDVTGKELINTFSVVWYDFLENDLNIELSLAADAKVMWGGEVAVKAISALPRKEHCIELVFGPKYSIGVISRGTLEQGGSTLEAAIAAFTRDIAIFDQRACSSPQTIFIEKSTKTSLTDIGKLFEKYFMKLPPKPSLDAFTTMKILNVRAEWGLAEDRSVKASTDGANWTICMDKQVSLKEAVQSRTIFLTEIDSWQQIIPLLSHKIQSVGASFTDSDELHKFANLATSRGCARVVRPGLMNLHESPWDGKLLVNQLVRWVTLKP